MFMPFQQKEFQTDVKCPEFNVVQFPSAAQKQLILQTWQHHSNYKMLVGTYGTDCTNKTTPPLTYLLTYLLLAAKSFLRS